MKRDKYESVFHREGLDDAAISWLLLEHAIIVEAFLVAESSVAENFFGEESSGEIISFEVDRVMDPEKVDDRTAIALEENLLIHFGIFSRC